MAYCTIDDVKLEAGTDLGTITDDDLTDLIAKSDKKINSLLRNAGITDYPTSDDDLEEASVKFTIAKVKRRQSHELSRPNSLNLGGKLAFSVKPEEEAKTLEAEAYEAVNRYAEYAGGSDIVIIPDAGDPYLDIREDL